MYTTTIMITILQLKILWMVQLNIHCSLHCTHYQVHGCDIVYVRHRKIRQLVAGVICRLRSPHTGCTQHTALQFYSLFGRNLALALIFSRKKLEPYQIYFFYCREEVTNSNSINSSSGTLIQENDSVSRISRLYQTIYEMASTLPKSYFFRKKPKPELC